MRKTARKILVLGIKCAIAAALLGWVLSKVSWHDYVVGADGEKIPVAVARAVPDGLRITRPDGLQEFHRWETMIPVTPSEAEAKAVYLRPGFYSVVRGMRYLLLGPAMVCMLMTFVLGGVRWRQLLKVQGIHLGLFEAMRLTWLGLFFNHILLGTTGGDLVKAYYGSRRGHGKTASLISVLVDRGLGLASLVILSAVMLATVAIGSEYADLSDRQTAQLKQAAIVVVILLPAMLAGGTFVCSRSIRRRLHLENLYARLPLSRYLLTAGESLGRYRDDLPALGGAMGISLAMHLLFVTGVHLIGRSLHLTIPWHQYAIYIPLIYVLAAIPIVPGGIGLMEGAYLAFFTAWAGEGEILALALLARLVPVFWSLPGVLATVSEPTHPSSTEMEAELTQDITP